VAGSKRLLLRYGIEFLSRPRTFFFLSEDGSLRALSSSLFFVLYSNFHKRYEVHGCSPPMMEPPPPHLFRTLDFPFIVGLLRSRPFIRDNRLQESGLSPPSFIAISLDPESFRNLGPALLSQTESASPAIQREFCLEDPLLSRPL